MIFFRWIKEIISKLPNDLGEQANIENAYYAPHLEKIFILILTRIPLWTNIMMTVFQTESACATSSGLESYFKNLKHLTGNDLKKKILPNDSNYSYFQI